jgi:hypothetical protein
MQTFNLTSSNYKYNCKYNFKYNLHVMYLLQLLPICNCIHLHVLQFLAPLMHHILSYRPYKDKMFVLHQYGNLKIKALNVVDDGTRNGVDM